MAEFSHTFAVCAYKESPYLRACLLSLKNQSVPARIFIATSTPNDHIRAVAEEFDVPLYISPRESGIGRDWNFAVSCAETDYVTIAHQDDLYQPDYLSRLIAYSQKAKDPLIFFTDYAELRGETANANTRNLNIKRKINALVRPKLFWRSKFMRRRALSVGNAICCPSVCLHMAAFPDFTFDETMGSNLDWDAWSRLAEKTGSFVYIPEVLMMHRIHQDSETTKQLDDGHRFEEDYAIIRRYWPTFIAKRIMKHYAKSADSNHV